MLGVCNKLCSTLGFKKAHQQVYDIVILLSYINQSKV